MARRRDQPDAGRDLDLALGQLEALLLAPSGGRTSSRNSRAVREVAAGPVLPLAAPEPVVGIREGGRPALAVTDARPAGVVPVGVTDDHGVDLVRRDAERGQALEHPTAVLAASDGKLAAGAGVQQDAAARRSAPGHS